MQIFNTQTRKKETLEPRVPGKLTMYVCGVTAYDYCHIGHARSSVVFDVLYRRLKKTGLDVTFARNFTDIDDKIINRANQEGLTAQEVAEKYIAAFYEDMDRLGILRPDVEPKATEHIPEMIALVQALIDQGKAYATDGGDVWFRVRAFESYGKLSGRSVDELAPGARVAPGESKEDPLDFALWKSAKPGEPFWESPWGKGRPGWHLECSAMNEKYFDLPVDIHGGGQDLVFPHHENEIAQTEAARGKDFVRYWVHNGFVQVDSEKMSKSLGNFSTIRDILQSWLPETLRYFLLTKHYRSPIDFTGENMVEAEKNLKRIYTAKAQIEEELGRAKRSKSPFPPELAEELAGYEREFDAALEDDLNTAAALGHVFGVIRLANRVLDDKNLRKSEGARELFGRILADLDAWSQVLGVLGLESGAFLAELKQIQVSRKGIDPAAVEALVAKRQEAKKAKDFAAADAVRDELAAMGVEVRDTPAGPVWDVA